MKKMFWLCLGITFCLTACQNAGQPETEVTVDFSVLEGEVAALEGEKDEEKQIYGRSAFLNKIREQAEGGKRETIQGTGIPDGGWAAPLYLFQRGICYVSGIRNAYLYHGGRIHTGSCHGYEYTYFRN